MTKLLLLTLLTISLLVLPSRQIHLASKISQTFSKTSGNHQQQRQEYEALRKNQKRMSLTLDANGILEFHEEDDEIPAYGISEQNNNMANERMGSDPYDEFEEYRNMINKREVKVKTIEQEKNEYNMNMGSTINTIKPDETLMYTDANGHENFVDIDSVSPEELESMRMQNIIGKVKEDVMSRKDNVRVSEDGKIHFDKEVSAKVFNMFREHHNEVIAEEIEDDTDRFKQAFGKEMKKAYEESKTLLGDEIKNEQKYNQSLNFHQNTDRLRNATGDGEKSTNIFGRDNNKSATYDSLNAAEKAKEIFGREDKANATGAAEKADNLFNRIHETQNNTGSYSSLNAAEKAKEIFGREDEGNGSVEKAKELFGRDSKAENNNSTTYSSLNAAEKAKEIFGREDEANTAGAAEKARDLFDRSSQTEKTSPQAYSSLAEAEKADLFGRRDSERRLDLNDGDGSTGNKFTANNDEQPATSKLINLALDKKNQAGEQNIKPEVPISPEENTDSIPQNELNKGAEQFLEKHEMNENLPDSPAKGMEVLPQNQLNQGGGEVHHEPEFIQITQHEDHINYQGEKQGVAAELNKDNLNNDAPKLEGGYGPSENMWN